MVYNNIFWLNKFPHNDGVFDMLSPHSLLVGLQHVDYQYLKHCRLEFGSYVQVHEEHNNTMTTQTIGAITLGPTGNSQGGYHIVTASPRGGN
jgi:hypothetical protein